LTAPASLIPRAAPQRLGPSLPITPKSTANGLVRLKIRADFLRVAATRRRAVRPGLVLQAAARPPGNSGVEAVRVGFTASKKVGNAVLRNRAKRRLRAAAATVLARDGHQGTDYVLIARAGTGERPYEELVHDLEAALRQIGRGRPKPHQGSRPPRGEEG
jgi:ribonuclease P protein component